MTRQLHLLAELRGQEQSLSLQIDFPARAAALRDSIRVEEERYGALCLDAEAHTAHATEMRERLVEIERQIEVLTAEVAKTAAATGKIVSRPPRRNCLQRPQSHARRRSQPPARRRSQKQTVRRLLLN